MTNSDNMDEFEPEGLDQSPQPETRGATRKNLGEAWRTQPLLKLLVIMIVVAVAIAGAMGIFSSNSDTTPGISKIARAPDLNEPPGGKTSPYFADQNRIANDERTKEAFQKGGSAMPTPIGQPVDEFSIKKVDPLAEFKAEAERLRQELKQERQQNTQQIQAMQQQIQRPARAERKEDDTLAQAMQKQMQQLLETWAPHPIKVVEGVTPKTAKREALTSSLQGGATTDAALLPASAIAESEEGLTSTTESKAVVQAGSVNYAELLTEANSDIQGPILAQILSGPLAGGRAIGTFEVMEDYLVMQFTLVNLKGKDYQVNAIALDPNTTLAGMATDVDHRYFTRVLLPAAASFMSQFGQALGQGGSTTTATENAVLVETAKKGYKDAIYEGLGQVGQTMGQFFQQQASQTKPLVRVAVGTPMGLFFLSPVTDSSSGQTATTPVASPFKTQASRMGVGAANPYAAYGAGAAGYPAGINPYANMGYSAAGGAYGNSGYQLPGTGVTLYNGMNGGYYGR